MSAEPEGLRFLPVGLDLRGRRCVVVGGGVIGTRKALTLAGCGAEVTVVSPEVTAALADAAAAGKLRHVPMPFGEGHLDGAFLVVAATDDEGLNEAVAEAAARNGALVCDASSAGRSQITFGAMLRREDATVAVFTDGRDPAHARRTRDRIAGFLDRRAAGIARGVHDGKPVTPGAADPAEPVDDIGARRSMVMIGASLPGGWGRGRGPRVLPSEPEAFAQVKTTHRALHDFLDHVRTATPVRDALVWNTCQRVELYAWLPDEAGTWTRAALEEELRRGLFPHEPPGLRVSELRGMDARHHVLRTACGLNSDLPGDRDVLAQLETAGRAAACAGTAGPHVEALVAEAAKLAGRVRAETRWGAVGKGYCAAALARVFEADELHPPELRYLVIGGSTTSRSVLAALRADHLVPERHLAVAYRDHHGQMRELRAAVGAGRRLRAHGYRDERILRAAADADVVVFGIDQGSPVWDEAMLRGLRDFADRPLTVVDFNSSTSLDEVREGQLPHGVRLWTARDLDRAVAAHVAITTTRQGFADAVAEAEDWIERYLTLPRSSRDRDRAQASRASPAKGTV